MINRQNFYQLAQEWQLNLSGAVDSSTAKKVGSLLGIDVLITGNLSEAGEAMDIAAKGIDTESGKVHILYPNRFSGGGKVLAGKTYSIPGRNDGYVIMVEGLQGIEVVRAFATVTPMAMTGVDFSKVGGVFKEVDEPAVLTRDLNIVAKETSPSSRGEGLIRIEIRK